MAAAVNIQNVIDDYHALLTDEMAEETDHLLRERLLERGLYFGKRPLCIVLRPHFYFEHDWRFLKQQLETLLTAFMKAHEACTTSDEKRAQLYLDPYEEELFRLDQSGPVPWSSSRLDTFYVVDEQVLKVVEYNAETPAGIGYGDELGYVFDSMPIMKRLAERFDLTFNPCLGNLHSALLSTYAEWGGREAPQIGILDWREVPTLNEHEISRIYFERRGTPSVLCDPRELEYRDGHLYKDDFRIDIIYKRVLYSELIEQMGLDNAVVNAIRDRAVYMTNSPSAKLMAKKASLAFLSDEQNAHLFNKDQLAAIKTHIPWTRNVGDCKTSYDGKQVDLLEFISANKDRLVLKPNDEYGGKGVVLGWECSQEGWDSTVHQAVETPHVVQERVPSVQRDFPMWLNGELDISPRYVDADPYVFAGRDVLGTLTRLSPLALLNVTAGGGSVVPAYILSPKG